MRVLFHGVHGTISLAMFEDLADSLRRGGHEVFFEFPDLNMSDPQEATAIVTRRGYMVGCENPDVMFVADFRCYRPRRCPVIDLGHGLGSKGAYFYPTTQYQSIVFAPSEWIARRIKAPKIYVAGMPKLDRAVFQRAANQKKRETEPPMVLIAPTHNRQYNCLEMIAPYLRNLVRDFRVVLKPHKFFWTSPKLTWWRDQIERCEREVDGITIDRGYNIADLLSEASVVVSDASSAFLEALGLGIPTIVCESEYMRQEKPKKPDAHEYLFQSLSRVITSGDQLLEAAFAAVEENPVPEEKLLSYVGKSIPRCIELLSEIFK